MAGILISLLIVLLILGIVCVIVQNYVPLDPPIKQLVMLVIAILFLIWIIALLSGMAPVLFFGPRLR
mgnify:CR=1 FL=1